MYLILASDTVPGVIRVRFPQAVAPDLGQNVIDIRAAQDRASALDVGHHPRNRPADVLHIEPRLKGRTR
jgi:hypothetical protein